MKLSQSKFLFPAWIEEVLDILPDGNYDSDDILVILDRINDLLKASMASTDNENLHDRISKEVSSPQLATKVRSKTKVEFISDDEAEEFSKDGKRN